MPETVMLLCLSTRELGEVPLTVKNVLAGEHWPDLITIARLERHFKLRLWGNEHKMSEKAFKKAEAKRKAKKQGKKK